MTRAQFSLASLHHHVHVCSHGGSKKGVSPFPASNRWRMKNRKEEPGPEPLRGLDKIDSLRPDELIAADRRSRRSYLSVLWIFFFFFGLFSLLDIYYRGCKTRRLLDSPDFARASGESGSKDEMTAKTTGKKYIEQKKIILFACKKRSRKSMSRCD